MEVKISEFKAKLAVTEEEARNIEQNLSVNHPNGLKLVNFESLRHSLVLLSD